MKIAVVFANKTTIDPLADVTKTQKLGSTWGSWSLWHQCHPQNVICHDSDRAHHLIDGGFSDRCNFYVPAHVYETLKKPTHVRAYGGDFIHEVVDREDIVALHLAASQNDIVVMIGFDWSKVVTEDPIINHQQANREGLIHQVIKSNPKKQWVIIDSGIPDFLSDIPNISVDTLNNVLD